MVLFTDSYDIVQHRLSLVVDPALTEVVMYNLTSSATFRRFSRTVKSLFPLDVESQIYTPEVYVLYLAKVWMRSMRVNLYS